MGQNENNKQTKFHLDNKGRHVLDTLLIQNDICIVVYTKKSQKVKSGLPLKVLNNVYELYFT